MQSTSVCNTSKMRYSLEPSYRKYVQGQGFMSFAENIGNKYGRKLFDKSIDVGKKISNKYGRKILDKSMNAGTDLADRITESSRNNEQKEDDRIMEET